MNGCSPYLADRNWKDLSSVVSLMFINERVNVKDLRKKNDLKLNSDFTLHFNHSNCTNVSRISDF